MDSELTEAELLTLNKLVDEVEKLNKQLQRFVQRSQPEPLSEDQSIQLENPSRVSIPEVAACGLDDPCDVEVKPIDSETSSQHLGVKYSSKSNNLIKSVTTFDASCEKVQKCDLVVDEYPKEDHDSLEVNTMADQSVVGYSVQTQVTFNHLSSEVSLDFVLNDVEISEESFETEFCVVKYTLSSCLQPVCENASMIIPSVFMKNIALFGSWRRLKIFQGVALSLNPPKKPPDSFLNALEVLKQSGVADISFMILIWLCKIDEVSCRILIGKHQTEFIWIIYVQVLLNQEMVFYDTYGNNGDIVNHLLSSVLLLQYTLGDTVDSCCLIMDMPFSGMVSGFSNCWTITLTTLWARSFIVFSGGVSNIFSDNLTEKNSIIPEQCLLRWKFLLMFGDLNCKEHLIVGQTQVGSYFAHLVVEKVIGTTKYNEEDSYFYVNLHPVDYQAVWVFNMDKSEDLHEEKWFKSPSCALSRKLKFCISDACDSAYQTSFSCCGI